MKALTDVDPGDEIGVDESVWKTRLWRYEQGMDLGLDTLDAAVFADSDADLARFRRLVKEGCDPKTALEILR